MKVLFPVLVLCTLAVVAVVLAIHFRVKRHLREEAANQPAPSPMAAPGRIGNQDVAASDSDKDDGDKQKR